MATFETPSYESQIHETQPPPGPSASQEAMVLDTSINGAAVHANAVSPFPTSPLPDNSDVLKNAPAQQHETAGRLQIDGATVQNATDLPMGPYPGMAPAASSMPEPSTDEPILPTEMSSSAPAPNQYLTQEQTAVSSQVDGSFDASNGFKEENSVPLRTEHDQASSNLIDASELSQPENLIQPPQNDGSPQAQADSVADSSIAAPQGNGYEIKSDPQAMDQDMPDVLLQSKVAREREDDDEQEPSAKRTKTDPEDVAEEPKLNSSTILPTTEPVDKETLIQSSDTSASVPAPVETTTFVPTASQPHPVATSQPASAEEWGPLKEVQARQLRQNLQNLKKGRHSQLFAKPVDYVALNIPSYPTVIKNPMDLSTMDKKLRDNQYASVAGFVDDFNLIVNNCTTFNGPVHPISQTANSLNAQFQVGLRKVPKAGEGAPPEQPKKRRSSLGPIPMPQRDSKIRESRVSLGAPQTSNGINQTFALPQDGNPLIRRTSTGMDGRPKREIHRPAPRDLPYLSAKPKKKKYQLELKFCEHVLGELKKGRYAHLMAPFKVPVDAVALNIPSYHKLIKKPMDFGTIAEKLSTAQYENAKEFEVDARLVFENAVKFNGPGHPISKVANELESQFTAEWSQKNSWIATNAPSSAPQSPEAESDSEVDDDEEEEDEEAEKARMAAITISDIHAQIAELAKKASALSSAQTETTVVKKNKKHASKSGKSSGGSKEKRKSFVAAPRPEVKKVSKPKAPKALKPLTVKEKEEISDRIGELTGDETARAAELIKAGLRKSGRGDLADKPDDELEFDIDSIPTEVLHQLLALVRRGDGTPDHRGTSQLNQAAVGMSTKKKAKPMSKHVQEASIGRLQGQLAAFEGNGGHGATSSSPDPKDDASDDDDDSGSESEEE